MITSSEITRASSQPVVFVLAWTASTAGPFYVYRDGVLAAVTVSTTWSFTADTTEVPHLEISETPLTTPGRYPARVTLGWYRVTGAQRYRIERYVGSTWVLVRIASDTGAQFQTWTSGRLTDETEYRYRVRPEAYGVAGDPREFFVFMVRHPDPPDVAYSYSANTGLCTVTVT